MPDAAGSWPEEGTQYLPGAPMEPVQQPYQAQPQQTYQPQPQYQQQSYPQQGYEQQQQQYEQQQYDQQQYAAQQQYGAPQQYPAQPGYQDQTVQQPPVFAEEEQAAVPSEFDHLFRDSSPVERRSISARGPVVSGPGAAASPGFPQAPVAQQPQAAQATAVYNPGQPPQAFEDRGPNEYIQQSQPFGGGYGAPGGPGGGPGAGNRRTPLIIGAVVVVVAAIGLYFGLSGGSGSGGAPTTAASTQASHASTETAAQQATAVYALVQESKQLRADAGDEAVDLRDCSNLSGLQAKMTATAAARQEQADKVAQLDVSKISNGAKLVGELNSAWTASAQSDAALAKVAGDVASGCSKSAVNNDPNYSAGTQASNNATSDKDSAASLWNRTMTNYGQPTITEGDL